MRLAVLLAGACLAACSPAEKSPPLELDPTAEQVEPPFGPGPDQTDGEAEDATFSGQASWSGLTPPETARLIVEVRDVTRTADVDDLVFREEFPAATSPAVFSGTVSKFDLIPGGNLVLRARLQDGYAILLTSDGDIDIADLGDTAGLDVALFNPEDLARGLPRKMITPAGTSYVCGGEPVTIALEAGAAYVTFGDGTSVKLEIVEPSVPPLARYTNGRFLVEVRQGELGPPLTYFGRGKAMPVICNLAE